MTKAKEVKIETEPFPKAKIENDLKRELKDKKRELKDKKKELKEEIKELKKKFDKLLNNV